jgi:hypothetical protein
MPAHRSDWTAQAVYSSHPVGIFQHINSLMPKEADWLAWEPEVLLGYFPNIHPEQGQVALDKIQAVQAVGAHVQLVCEYCYPLCVVTSSFCNLSVTGTVKEHHVEELFYTVDQLTKIADLLHEDELKFTG